METTSGLGFQGESTSTMRDMTGLELREKRQAAKVRASDVAIFFDRSPAFITRLEHQDQVDNATARRYLRAVSAIVPLRMSIRRQLLQQLEALMWKPESV